MDNVLLWRVVYSRKANLSSDGFCAGPWHPDKDHVNRCASVLRSIAQSVGVQSNQQAVRTASTWLKR